MTPDGLSNSTRLRRRYCLSLSAQHVDVATAEDSVAGARPLKARQDGRPLRSQRDRCSPTRRAPTRRGPVQRRHKRRRASGDGGARGQGAKPALERATRFDSCVMRPRWKPEVRGRGGTYEATPGTGPRADRPAPVHRQVRACTSQLASDAGHRCNTASAASTGRRYGSISTKTWQHRETAIASRRNAAESVSAKAKVKRRD